MHGTARAAQRVGAVRAHRPTYLRGERRARRARGLLSVRAARARCDPSHRTAQARAGTCRGSYGTNCRYVRYGQCRQSVQLYSVLRTIHRSVHQLSFAGREERGQGRGRGDGGGGGCRMIGTVRSQSRATNWSGHGLEGRGQVATRAVVRTLTSTPWRGRGHGRHRAA